MSDTSSAQRKTFIENWTIFRRAVRKFERRFVPPLCRVASGLALIAAVMCLVSDRIEKAIFMVLIAGFALGLAVAVPVLTQRRSSE